MNGYQSHMYFRRALAYFQEGQLGKASCNLDNAVALGLSAEEDKKLRTAIAKKIDIV